MSRVEPNRNVYVGHRYVPKIFGEWDKQNEYEGLSIVTHQGGSYTSKKRVPVGIDILNNEFWVVTGNYNAQVKYYREETERVSNDLLLKSDKTYVDTELGKKSEKTYVDTELGKKSDKTYVDTELDKKSDITYVDTEIINLNNDFLKNKPTVNLLDLYDFQSGDDITDACNTIIDTIHQNGGGTLYIPEGDYNIEGRSDGKDDFTGIQLKSNVNLLTHEKTILRLIPNDSERSYVISAVNVENVDINVGTVIGDRSGHIGTTGEWGYGIAIDYCKNVNVNAGLIRDCWGDGILLRGTENSNIIVDTIDNCRRQGISIISGYNIYVDFQLIQNINGTNPMSAIDIENDNPDQFVNNIHINGGEINNCRFGYQIYVNNSIFDNILIENGNIENVEEYGFIISGAYSGTVKNVTLKNIDINSNIELGKSYIENKDNINIINCKNIKSIFMNTVQSLYIEKSIVEKISGSNIEKVVISDSIIGNENILNNVITAMAFKSLKLFDTDVIGGQRGIQTSEELKLLIEGGSFKSLSTAIGLTMENVYIRGTKFIDCENSVVLGPETVKNVLIDNAIIVNSAPITLPARLSDVESVSISQITFN